MANKQNLIEYVTSEDRICPMPLKWIQIFKVIGDDLPKNKLVPLILAAWNFTEDGEKQHRLIEQIEFAFSLNNAKTEEFVNAIYALTNEDWYRG